MPDKTPYEYCDRCDGFTGEDPAIVSARKYPPGSVGWERALTSWSGEPCDCPEGPLHVDPDAR